MLPSPEFSEKEILGNTNKSQRRAAKGGHTAYPACKGRSGNTAGVQKGEKSRVSVVALKMR